MSSRHLKSADISKGIMMNRRKIEIYVGLFVIIGVVTMGYLILAIGELNFFPKNPKTSQVKVGPFGH